MKVQLTYFKPNGKWYTEAEYETEWGASPLNIIWGEVETLNFNGRPPGLAEGSKWTGFILVNVPDHINNYLGLLLV